MLFFGKKKKTQTPQWFRWAMLGFLAYVLLSHYLFNSDETDEAVPTEIADTGEVERDDSDITKAAKGGSPATLGELAERLGSAKDNYVKAVLDPFSSANQQGSETLNTESAAPQTPLTATHTAPAAPEETVAKPEPSTQDNLALKRYPALCGQTVTAKIRGSLENGNTFDENHDDAAPITFNIGSGEQRDVFNALVLGLFEGDTNKAVLKAEQVYGDTIDSALHKPEDRVVFYTQLLSIKPNLVAATPFVIHTTHHGEGERAACGSNLTLQIQRYDAQGALQSDALALLSGEEAASDTLAYTLGSGTLGYGIDISAADMRVNEKRLVILPPMLAGAAQELLVLQITRVK